jgi:hypothetical protein
VGRETIGDAWKTAALGLKYGLADQGRVAAPFPAVPPTPLPAYYVYASFAHGHVSLGPEPLARDNERSRFRNYRVFLSLVAAAAPHLHGTVTICLGDIPEPIPIGGWPTLAFNKHRDHATEIVLVPNVDFVRSQAHAHRRRLIDRARIPWEGRDRLAFWRGSSTGLGCELGEDGTSNPRLMLCRAAARLRELADIRLGRFLQDNPPLRAEVEAAGLLGEFVPPERQIRHRRLVSIDGNAGEWEGMYWKLYSGSTVLMVASPWQQWYSDSLKAWEHYVPVAADMSDLEERLRWVLAHEDECRRMGERAREFIRTRVTYRAAVEYTIQQLARALARDGQMS